MLAEKRWKQKWSDDPRNTRWSKGKSLPFNTCARELVFVHCVLSTDQGRYGYRMLQRMGWSQGQGLGRGKEGRKELIRVSRRDDNSGTALPAHCTEESLLKCDEEDNVFISEVSCFFFRGMQLLK